MIPEISFAYFRNSNKLFPQEENKPVSQRFSHFLSLIQAQKTSSNTHRFFYQLSQYLRLKKIDFFSTKIR